MCAESHKQATAQCPNVYEKKVRICKKAGHCELSHKPPEPPEISKICASSCYDLMTADGNWRAWLGRIADIGANGCRFFAIQCFGQKDKMNPFQPYPMVGTYYRPDIDKNFPLFQLRTEEDEEVVPYWNEEWWDKYRAILEEMKLNDLTAHIVGDNYCDLKKDKHQKYYHPYYCSIEALEDYPPSTPGGVWGEAMKRYHRALYKRLIKEAIDIGVDFTFEPMNEYDAKNWNDEFMVAWHKWAVEQVDKFGTPYIDATLLLLCEIWKKLNPKLTSILSMALSGQKRSMNFTTNMEAKAF